MIIIVTKLPLTIGQMFKDCIKILCLLPKLCFYALLTKHKKFEKQKAKFVALTSRYYGHSSILRSLFSGLKKNNENYIFNPIFSFLVKGNVFACFGADVLPQLIEWRKSGKIKKLIAGPMCFSHPEEGELFLKSPYVDKYVVAGNWMQEYFLAQYPEIASKLHIWGSGINISQQPIPHSALNTAMVYCKKSIDLHKVEEVKGKVLNVMEENGLKVKLIEYGNYKLEDYLSSLNEVDFAVVITESETQGISIAEAWSMNVPTLVWNNRGNIVRGTYEKWCHFTNSCPYLSFKNGLFWDDVDDLDKIIKDYNQNQELWRKMFSPREWVENNLSDEISVKNLLNLFEPK